MSIKHDSVLREAIIAEMKRRKDADFEQYGRLYGEMANFGRVWGYCTWWFKFHIDEETRVIRRELERMERDGIVVRTNQSTNNNTMWALAEDSPQQVELSREA